MKAKANKKFKIKKKWPEIIFLFAMLILPVVSWVVFWFCTRFSTIILAFKTPAGEWSLNNFETFFLSLKNPENALNIALRNTLIYFLVTLLIVMPGSFIICYFLFKKIKFSKAFRAIFYFPAIVPQIALVSTYKQFIAPWGVLNKVLSFFGSAIPDAGLLGDPKTATWAIVVYVIWTGFCGNILLFSGAMSRIPRDVLESANLDGANSFVELFKIILPMVFPTITTVIILTFTNIFSASGPILLFTQGQYETTTLSYWIFNNVLGDGMGSGGRYNLVSAVGLFFTVIGVPIILFVRGVLAKVPSVEY